MLLLPWLLSSEAVSVVTACSKLFLGCGMYKEENQGENI